MRYPLGGLRVNYLNEARKAVEAAKDLDFDDWEQREALADSVVCQLRAAGLLAAMPRFMWINDEVNGQEVNWIHDVGRWPNHVDVTETLFGHSSISAGKAEWAADRLNRGESISPKAWNEYREKMKESAG